MSINTILLDCISTALLTIVTKQLVGIRFLTKPGVTVAIAKKTSLRGHEEEPYRGT